MDFGILGPLAVSRDGEELELGAAKQRALLAVMLLHAGETMPTERLVDALWGERPPARAVKAVQVYISQLRKTLGDGVVETRPLGYVVRVEDGALDLQRFESLLGEGRRLLGEGHPQEAREVLRESLALWRGEPLVDFRYEAFAASAIGRLDELRLIALEHKLEADLAVGDNAEAVPELEALVRDYPLRESLRGLLMRALYRSGRQADALTVMQDARATLRDELGLAPGQPLQRLEKLILLQDPSLDETAAPLAPARASARVGSAADAMPPPPAGIKTREQRKVVTVLFADVTDSTLLGDSFDPEVARAMLAPCIERMKAAAERHGGVVEKFTGDAVMAVFGIPVVHEDDAQRALRAALEIRETIVELGMEGRVGVESGECVVGTGERLVTGRAVTTAMRLEQAAQPGEILVGADTMQLARDSVVAEEREPLVLEGKRMSVRGWGLLSVSAEGPVHRFESPFVGREHEVKALRDAWDRACDEPRCELVTVVGDAGVGKSRLVAEFLQHVDATVAHGRCLSYGAGITYWPVQETLTQLQANLARLDPAMATPLQALLAGAGAASTDEFAWAYRKFVESVAQERPLALVFDDIHWGEEALLNLIEHVAFVSAGAPILLLCMARPNLLDRRAGWRGVVRVEPLDPRQAEQLAHASLGEGGSDPALAQRIAVAAEGNPLFVEELAAMLRDANAGQVALPPTIGALLAARLDQLDLDERAVLEAAAVEGEVFHAGAVRALAPEQSHLTAQLTALVRKEFVRPDRSMLGGEDAFRFRHLLLRDAAYQSIPKAARSLLHERHANWLEQRYEPLDAFVGYHLEQSYTYRVELRDTGAETDALARRASERLEAAAGAALRRSDFSAAVNLLERAASPPPVPELRRARLTTELAATLMEAGRLEEAGHVLDTADALGTAADDGTRARLLVERRFLDMHRAAPDATQGVARVTQTAIPIFEQAGDQRGLCRVLQLEALAAFWRGSISVAAEAWERAAVHARQAGMEHEWAVIVTWIASSTWTGAMPVDEGIRRCEEIRTLVRGHPACEAEILRPLGGLHGFAGRFDVARSLFATRHARLDELGRGVNYAARQTEPYVEMLAGDFAAAEESLRLGYDALEAMGENAMRSTTAALLSRALFGQQRYDEAERFTELAQQLAEPDDLLTQIVWRGVRARLFAARGRFDDAEGLAREAVALAGETDFVNSHADALVDLAAVLEASGRSAETPPIIDEAIRLYNQKGNTVSATAARAQRTAAPV